MSEQEIIQREDPRYLVFPDDWEQHSDEVMSNFDHQIDRKVEAEIKGQDIWAPYPGYNFYGHVWWIHPRQQWGCDVWRYKQSVEIVTTDTLEELMEVISAKYGWE